MSDFLNDSRSLENSHRTGDGAGHRFTFQGKQQQQKRHHKEQKEAPAVDLNLSTEARAETDEMPPKPPPPPPRKPPHGGTNTFRIQA